MDAQADENRRAREANEKMFQTQLGFEKEKFGLRMGLETRAQEFAEKTGEFGMAMTEKQWEEQQKDKQFNRQSQLLSGFTGMINSGPQIRQNLINTWRT
jgi:hypothetical protein